MNSSRTLNLCYSLLAVVLSAMAAPLNATSISSVPWDEVVDRADHIALVRVTGTVIVSEVARCKFRVRVEPLEVYRGAELLEFHVDETMVVGARYLVVGNVSDGCGPGKTEVRSEYFPSSYPILPYGYEIPINRAWMALGTDEITFPSGFDVQHDGKACIVVAEESSVLPCLVPPPAVRFRDVRSAICESERSECRAES